MANTRKTKGDKHKITGNIQKQYENLFSEQGEPPASMSVREQEAMKARIAELEAKLTQSPSIDRRAAMPFSTSQADLLLSAGDAAADQAEGTGKPARMSFLVGPVFVGDTEKTRLAKLLHQIILVCWGLPLLAFIVSLLNPSIAQYVVPAEVLLVISLPVLMVLNYRGREKLASYLMVGVMLALFTYLNYFNAGEPKPILLLTVIVIMVSGLLLGSRGPIITALLLIVQHAVLVSLDAGGLITPITTVTTPLQNILVTAAGYLAIGFMLRLAISRIQVGLDKIRADEHSLQIKNKKLVEFSISLEQKISDRTHDLELASEVGRAITEKVANLSKMLTDAVDLIRSRFDFYYAQVYLLDPSGRTLTLRAGTGNAGVELLRRGHHLVVSSASLNGRAASERHAVIVEDTQASSNFLPNLLLPLTRSEMAVPLIANGTVVGVLDLQSERPNTFSAANLPAFEVLAGQLAIAIQNATLFEQAEESRQEMAAQAHRFTASGWQDFMNGVDRSEKIGFIYSQHELLPLVETQKLAAENTLVVPIQILGTHIGEIRLDDEANRIWSATETEIVRATVSQVARKIESLRLLAQAENYRAVAEQASRRLTHEGWGEYLQARNELGSGFVYDRNQVQPLSGNGHKSATSGLSHALVVRDETIGEMLVETQDGGSNASELIAAVAEQLSGRIENLRLLEQTQQQRAEAGKLYEIGQKLSAARDRQEIVAAVAENLDFPQINRAILLGYEYGESGEMENVSIRANWYRGSGPEPAPVGRRFSTKVFTLANNFNGTDPSFVANTHNDPRVDPATRAVFENQGIRAFIAMPVWGNARQTGSLLLQSEEEIPFTGNELLPYTSLMQQVTSALENQDLLEQTQQGEARLRTLVENAPEAIVVIDMATGLFTEPNENAVRLYGLSREELVKVGPAQMSPPTQPDGRPSIDAAMEKIGEAMDGGTPVFEWLHLNGQGREIPCEVRLVRLPGEKPLVRASVTNITERKTAQETIARRATELQTVATLSTTASTVLDPDKLLQAVVDLTKERFGIYHAHIYLANETWNSLLLAAGAGDIGRQMVAEEHTIQMDAEKSLVARAARERHAVIVNDVRSDPGFLPNPLLPETRSEMAVPMIVGENVLGVFDVQSVAENHFSEEDANIYTTLSAQVAVALQNARLYVEQSATVTQLRELDRLKSSFLANMSHELRTPLNSILGFADVMLEELDGPITENMNNDLGLIQKNGQHLLHLINDVLDMAKIEAGRMNLNPEKFVIHEILEEVTSITSTLASEKNLALFVDKDSDHDLEIFADRTRLRQVMINLVNNSIKFTDQGKIAICAKQLDGARVLITVTDTGIGIPPDKIESVFQEFNQVDTSSTRKAGGTGLGLPISRKLVEMHGGRLWAESSGVAGEGSRFYVELPLEARIVEIVENQGF